MSLPLVINPEAEEDLDESTRWYKRQRSGLDEEFRE